MTENKPVLSAPNDAMLDAARQATAPASETESQVDESRLSPIERAKRDQGRFQKKINDMTSRNERLLEALGESTKRYSSLEEKFSALESKLSQGLEASAKPKSPLASYSTQDLERAELEFLSSDDPVQRAKVYDIRSEIRRRDREEVMEQLNSQLRGERESQDLRNQSRSAFVQAAKLLGDQGANYVDFSTGMMKETQEVRTADAVYTQLKDSLKRRGIDADRVPELQAYAVLLADRVMASQRATQSNQEYRSREEELRMSRIRDQVGAQGEAAPVTVDRVSAALQAKDIDGVLSELDFVKEADARRRKLMESRTGQRGR